MHWHLYFKQFIALNLVHTGDYRQLPNLATIVVSVDRALEGKGAKTPELALCPAELSNVALRMAPRMQQNMQLETHKVKKCRLRDPSLNGKGVWRGYPLPIPTAIVSAPGMF